MSQFNLENDVNTLLRMDAPITKGPQMRWQRKQNESRNESMLNCSVNSSTSQAKTPMKALNCSERSTGLSPHKPGSKTPGNLNRYSAGIDFSLQNLTTKVDPHTVIASM